jgi:hypothetical protein
LPPQTQHIKQNGQIITFGAEYIVEPLNSYDQARTLEHPLKFGNKAPL